MSFYSLSPNFSLTSVYTFSFIDLVINCFSVRLLFTLNVFFDHSPRTLPPKIANFDIRASFICRINRWSDRCCIHSIITPHPSSTNRADQPRTCKSPAHSHRVSSSSWCWLQQPARHLFFVNATSVRLSHGHPTETRSTTTNKVQRAPSPINAK